LIPTKKSTFTVEDENPFFFICPLNLALRNFSYIVVVSFIGGGNWSTQRNPQVEDYARGCILHLKIKFVDFIFSIG
jgi:hypothetical protein